MHSVESLSQVSEICCVPSSIPPIRVVIEIADWYGLRILNNCILGVSLPHFHSSLCNLFVLRSQLHFQLDPWLG